MSDKPMYPLDGNGRRVVFLPDGTVARGDKPQITLASAEPYLKPCPFRGGNLMRYDPLHPLTCLALGHETVCHCGDGVAWYHSGDHAAGRGWNGWYAPGHDAATAAETYAVLSGGLERDAVETTNDHNTA